MTKIEEEPLEENFSATMNAAKIQSRSRNNPIRTHNTQPKARIIYEELYRSAVNSRNKAKYNPDIERMTIERINTFETFQSSWTMIREKKDKEYQRQLREQNRMVARRLEQNQMRHEQK